MGDVLVRSPSSRQSGAFRARKSSAERSHKIDPYQNQQLSRFMSGAFGLTAQSNPNWRLRPSTEGSSGNSESHQEKKRSKRDQKPPPYSYDHLKWQSGSGDTEPGALFETVKTAKPAAAHLVRGMRAHECPEDAAFYQVYKHADLDILGYAGEPLSLMDVGLAHNGNQKSVVKIQRLSQLSKEPSPCYHIAGNIQTEQLKAALRAGATTPRKGQSASGFHPLPEIPRVSATVPGSESVSVSYSVPTPAAEVQKTSSSPSTNLSDFDRAFQKMLEKLTRGSQQARSENVDGKAVAIRVEGPEKGESKDNGKSHERILEASQKGENFEASQVRYPVPSTGRRLNTASEPCPAHGYVQPQGHKKEGTGDSGICMEENGKSRSLNPRAREFLTKEELISLKQREYSNSSEDSQQSTQSLSSNRSGSVSAGKLGSHTSGQCLADHLTPANASTGGIASFQPTPVTGVSPLTSGAQPAMGYSAAQPVLYNGLLSGGALVPFVTDQMQCLGSAPTALTTLSTNLATPPVLQPIAGNLLSFPPTSLFGGVFPAMAGSVDPCLVAPASCPAPAPGQSGVSGPMAARPPPVPKPRRPDPGDQQAYEAWIEWRKANEPGYALECKLRQQRRAQRSMIDSFKAKACKKPEEVSSTV